MSQHVIIPKALTAEVFKVFGDVIEATDASKFININDGYTKRFHDLADVDVTTNNGRTLINIFRSTPLVQPIAIKMMERHPLSSQAFIPLGKQPYLVVVAPKGEFNIEHLEVFIASATQGVTYHAGTWHHYRLSLHH